MSEWILSGITILLFYITPLILVSIIIRDVITTRNRGRELDVISNGLRGRFELLESLDIAGFDASLSNWLEVEVKNPKTNWLRASLRLFTQAKLIGLGEGHREMLLKDHYYRDNVLQCGRLLTDSFENGNREEVMSRIGTLFAVFLCKECDESSIDKISSLEVDHIVLEALTQSANRIQEGYLDADKYITNALKTITGCCNPEKTGIPILLLQWASLRISHRHTTPLKKYNIIANSTQELSKQFLTIAEQYRKNDFAGAVDVVSKSF